MDRHKWVEVEGSKEEGDISSIHRVIHIARIEMAIRLSPLYPFQVWLFSLRHLFFSSLSFEGEMVPPQARIRCIAVDTPLLMRFSIG